jgi:hypothetical protein
MRKTLYTDGNILDKDHKMPQGKTKNNGTPGCVKKAWSPIETRLWSSFAFNRAMATKSL